MQYWNDKLKLGKGSGFVKRDLRMLLQTDAEFDADFWLDAAASTKRCEVWMGMVIEREFGAVLAMRDLAWSPPTVNDLASLLTNAMVKRTWRKAREFVFTGRAEQKEASPDNGRENGPRRSGNGGLARRASRSDLGIPC